MAENANEYERLRSKRGNVKPEDRFLIIDKISKFKKEKPLNKIPWARFSNELKMYDTSGKFITGRKLLESWTNYLHPDLNLAPFTESELAQLMSYYIQARSQNRRAASGKYQLPLDEKGKPRKWIGLIPGRSPNMIKNLYYSKIFTEAAMDNIDNIKKGNPIIFPVGITSMPPSNEPSPDRDDSDDIDLEESFYKDQDFFAPSPAATATATAPTSVPRFDEYEYPWTTSHSPFRYDGFGSPGGAGAVFGPETWSPSSSIERKYGGKATRKARKSAKNTRISSRKARKSSKKARKSTRK